MESIYSGTKKLLSTQVPNDNMRLISQKHSEYKDKKYEKFWIVIPSKLIKKLGWKKGQELKADIKNEKLVVEKN